MVKSIDHLIEQLDRFKAAVVSARESRREFLEEIEAYLERALRLPARRIRTGVAPKWHNRTRRKQRLTRLGRRRKRQTKHHKTSRKA